MFLARILSLWAVVTVVASQEMPSCAASCMEKGIVDSSCSPTDTRCICEDPALLENISGCILGACTVKEALTSQNASNTMCGVEPRDISHITPIVTSVFMSLAIAATVVRCWESRRHFGPEDVFAILALVWHHGYGKDIWTLPFDNITRIVKFTWILQLCYTPALASTKMAFLCLYLRLFPSEGIRRANWVLIAINIVYFFVFTFGIAFNCLPVTYIWNKWHGEAKGSCLNFNIFGICNAAVNIALDLAVIGLPLHKIAGLSVSWSRKIMLLWMFGLGFFITIVSILRLRVVITYGTTTNATYDTVPTSYWSIIECFTGIVCINLPPIRRLYRKIAHLCFGSPYTEEEQLYRDITPGRSSSRRRRRRSPLELSVLGTIDTTIRRESPDRDTEYLKRPAARER
ncbi:hypothetical protein ASPVEDRAFT_56813 [Aspergillus versicolor CBS 583.65]|uniref:CFEM domain-containing protein n=1 Tax=Aspergillus versicolor CBS 583.65 TaxID=1036611 RepID=A0A1L9Q0X6_ASPVE|nr:uncharacterized protein ASPVEDRAFT_56813 [Aspergillus versicolor CBS 583.65]OJJ07425.1 hypothetical protein ASPVEDRAFT_56813 [Aspergillus versicolor CBS 583.65]